MLSSRKIVRKNEIVANDVLLEFDLLPELSFNLLLNRQIHIKMSSVILFCGFTGVTSTFIITTKDNRMVCVRRTDRFGVEQKRELRYHVVHCHCL